MRKIGIILLLFVAGCTFNADVSSIDGASGKNGDLPFKVTIDKSSMPSSRVEITEGSGVVLFVTLSPVRSTDTTLGVSFGSDFAGSVSQRFQSYSQSLTIAAGSSSAMLVLTSIDDSILQNTHEDFILQLASSYSDISMTDASLTVRLLDNEVVPVLSAFSILGITSSGADSAVDNKLGDTVQPTIHFDYSANATAYDITVFLSNGFTVACAKQTTTTSPHIMTGCSLTPGSTYKVKVVAKDSLSNLAATNDLFSFSVNQAPGLGSGGNGIWYVMVGSSLTINAQWAASPAVGAATDPDGDVLTFTQVGSVSLGVVTNNSTHIVYTPLEIGYGKETFSFTIVDSWGATLTQTMTIHVVGPHTWTGSSSAVWSSSATGNWCGTLSADKHSCAGASAVPGVSDIVVFDNTCVSSNCSATTNYNVSVLGLYILSNTLTQGAGATISVGTDGIAQKGGAFVGNDSNITSVGPLTLTSGNFKSTSATLKVSGVQYTANQTIATFGVSLNFDANGGTVFFNPGYIYGYDVDIRVNAAQNISFYNVFVDQCNCNSAGGLYFGFLSEQFVTVNNRLTVGTNCGGGAFSQTKMMGLWHIKKDFEINTNAQDAGASFYLNGTGTQQYTYTGGRAPSITVDNAAANVVPAGGTTSLMAAQLKLLQGSFRAPSGDFYVGTFSDVNAVHMKVESGTTFDANSGRLFVMAGYSYGVVTTITLDVPDNFTVNDLVLDQFNCNSAGNVTLTTVSGRKVIADGNLVIGNDCGVGFRNFFLNGQWQTKKHITVGANLAGGSAVLTAKGAGNFNYTRDANAVTGGLTLVIDNAAMNMTMNQSSNFYRMYLTAGTMNLGSASYALNISNLFSLSTGTILNLNGGSWSYGLLSNFGTINP